MGFSYKSKKETRLVVDQTTKVNPTFAATTNRREATKFGQAIVSSSGSDRIKRLDPNVSEADDSPAQGAGQLEAQNRAERVARRQARGRFGFLSTIMTTPLGETSGTAMFGRRRLLGE